MRGAIVSPVVDDLFLLKSQTTQLGVVPSEIREQLNDLLSSGELGQQVVSYSLRKVKARDED